MSARRERSDPEWQAIIAEHQVLKRKLQSKSEALLIISKDLEKAQSERDQFKLMAEKLQERCQAFKREQADIPLTSDKGSLIQMLKDLRNQKLAHQKHSEVLQQKLNEAYGDVKLLREKFARQTVGDEGVGARHFPLHEREKLVCQLEESQQEREHWHKEYQSQADIASESQEELEVCRLKIERLNQELSYLLTGDKKRIIDVDALCMENKYLQERITQCQAEKNSLHTQLRKYKNMLNSRKPTKGELNKPGLLRSSGIVMSPRQLKELLSNGSQETSADQVADLQSIVSALLETINDKNLALHHLRSTNKILGNRVSDLESKLKTLEVAGLWHMQGKYSRETSCSEDEGRSNVEASNVIPFLPAFKHEIHCQDEGHETNDVDKNKISAANCIDTDDPSNDDEFLSSLGSRLSKITSTTNVQNDYKLVSVSSSEDSANELSSGNLQSFIAAMSPIDVDLTAITKRESADHEIDDESNRDIESTANNATNGYSLAQDISLQHDMSIGKDVSNTSYDDTHNRQPNLDGGVSCSPSLDKIEKTIDSEGTDQEEIFTTRNDSDVILSSASCEDRTNNSCEKENRTSACQA
ncbi:coiled-coil domain-containing protein 149-like [Clavelina lepadiformis]|uniref:coiled-coil domain-containing protein 149-like n=1 Tax=Clavelina lepadiformis TaxID=159417 RepID=UPI004042728A